MNKPKTNNQSSLGIAAKPVNEEEKNEFSQDSQELDIPAV